MVDKKLSPITFSLPEWWPSDLSFMREEAFRLRAAAKKAGQHSDDMKHCAREMLEAVSRGKPVEEQVCSGKDIRLVLMLWLYDNPNGMLFENQVPFTPELLDCFNKVRPRLSQLALHDMAQVYFDHYDRIPHLSVFCDYLRSQFESQSFSGKGSRLALLSQNNKTVFHPEAPAYIVQKTVKSGATLGDAMIEIGIPETEGLFRERCALLYYIESLEQIDPGEESDLFSEIVQKKIVELPYKDGLLIGHAVLKILIGKISRAEIPMPENWMKIILTIAGDPRSPTVSNNFQTWWQRLDKDEINKVRGWLSRFDLDLFLRALEAFSYQSRDEDLRRMFPARKRFLVGLYEQGLVSHTRLFIGRHAVRFLLENYDEKELPVYAALNDKYKSIIHMKVAGYHVIEGSHQAKFWIFDQLPKDAKVFDYNIKKFSQAELNSGLEAEYHMFRKKNLRRFPEMRRKLSGFSEMRRRRSGPSFPQRIVHYPNVAWQSKVVEAFDRLGVKLDVEELLTPEDYQVYKQKYGLEYY